MKRVRTIDYEKCRAEFAKIAHLTEPKELNEALPGRLKYNADTLKALPFEGVSVIHNIDAENAKQLGLSDLVNTIKLQLDSLKKIAFVSTDSFHATTFDLINQGYREKLEKADFSYSKVRLEVVQKTQHFLKECGLHLSESVKITGLGLFAPRVLKLNLEFSTSVIEIFQNFRSQLHQRLLHSVPGYAIVRDHDWNEMLAGHITFGYVVKPLAVDEIDPFLRKLENFNTDFHPLDFILTQGEVTQFTDMDHYSPVK